MFGDFADILAVGDIVVGVHYEDGTGKQAEFLDQHAVCFAETGLLVVRKE